eukprot:UN07566
MLSSPLQPLNHLSTHTYFANLNSIRHCPYIVTNRTYHMNDQDLLILSNSDTTSLGVHMESAILFSIAAVLASFGLFILKSADNDDKTAL